MKIKIIPFMANSSTIYFILSLCLNLVCYNYQLYWLSTDYVFSVYFQHPSIINRLKIKLISNLSIIEMCKQVNMLNVLTIITRVSSLSSM